MADVFDFYVYDDRSIKFAIAEPIMLEDKDVTQFRFRIPKVLNNINMTSWEWWFIFVNAKKIKYTTQLTLTDDEDEPENYSVATYTVGYGFSGYVGQVSFSIEALNVSGEDIVNEWHTRTYNTHVIDTLQGTRAVIPEPEADAGTGLTAEEKSLILELFSKAAYAEDDASTAYDRLEALWTTTTRTITYNLSHVSSSNTATSVDGGSSYTTTLTADSNYTLNTVTVLMGGVNVTSQVYSSGTITIPNVTGNIVITATAVLAAQSITAVYTQSGTVYDTDSLDSLKADLVVTANYSGGTSETVPASNYTLSGTLTVGTSTITVSYAGLTTTFNVTVTADSGLYPLENGTHTFSANDRTLTVTNGYHFAYTAPNASSSQTAKGAYLNLSKVSENDTSATEASNINKTTTLFTLPASATVVFEVKNISFTNVGAAGSTNKYALAVRSNTTSIITTGDKDISDTADISVTQTISSDTAITCVFAYLRNPFSAFEADISLTVNGVRWI